MFAIPLDFDFFKHPVHPYIALKKVQLLGMNQILQKRQLHVLEIPYQHVRFQIFLWNMM